jgi:hypothetical protein
MSDLEQAARQALEALGRCSIRLNDLDFRESVLSTIDTLRAALAQQQAEPVVEPLTLGVSNRLNAEAMALSAAIANLEKLSPDDNSQ